jgi:trk system potassium uptake protein TrkA
VTLPTECVLTAIIRKGELLIPHGDMVFQSADEVIALVHTSRLKDMAAMLGKV